MNALDRLPADDCFTWDDALSRGVRPEQMRRLVETGQVIRLVRGVYAVAGLPLTIERRAAAIARVVPADAVVTDETAAWLHGVDVFGFEGQDGQPPLSFFQRTTGNRLRHDGIKSGERRLADGDIVTIGGVPVTSLLRTAADLARLLRADRALGALDGLARCGLDPDELFFELDRFKGYRGIIQARGLVGMIDGRSGSMVESKLRHDWRTSGVRPLPTPQFEVRNPWTGHMWALDLAVEELRYAVEYDGEVWHASEERRAADRRKRDYLTTYERWTIDVLTKAHVYVPNADPMAIITSGMRRARHRLSHPEPEWRWPA